MFWAKKQQQQQQYNQASVAIDLVGIDSYVTDKVNSTEPSSTLGFWLWMLELSRAGFLY